MIKKYKLGGRINPLPLEEIRRLVKDGKYMRVNQNIIDMITEGRVLDLGCGIGNFSYQLATKYRSAKVTGVDYADYSIEIAAALYKDTPNLSFALMDATSLKFQDHIFDTVCFLEVIEHLGDPVRALKEINRVLKQEGN